VQQHRPGPGQRPDSDLAGILAEYLERFASHNGRLSVQSRLNAMFAHTGTSHPQQVTTRALLAWITSGGSNNTVRARLSTGRAFLRWCHRAGVIDHEPWMQLPDITKQYPTTYGKVQDKNPARFLTYHEAFVDLIGACQDGTPVGLRDELAIRLGLSGMRVNEIAQLTVAHVATLPTVSWMGKGNRPRQLVAGQALCEGVGRWLALRTDHTGQPTPTHPLLLGQTPGANRAGFRTRRSIDWSSTAHVDKSTIWRLVTTRAKIAGLGHVAPHDLRRSAAAIMHHATTADGGHRFDLLDIQKVLGHADPATTMRSYLDPMDSAVRTRAAHLLD
jgi:integrase